MKDSTFDCQLYFDVSDTKTTFVFLFFILPALISVPANTAKL